MQTDNRATCKCFFHEDLLLFVSFKIVNGLAAAGSLVVQVDGAAADNGELGQAVLAAWDAVVVIWDDAVSAPKDSWAFVSGVFEVTEVAHVRQTTIIRHDDHIRLVISELKGDNRSNRSADAIVIPLDVSDEELGAAVRRAMELTTS